MHLPRWERGPHLCHIKHFRLIFKHFDRQIYCFGGLQRYNYYSTKGRFKQASLSQFIVFFYPHHIKMKVFNVQDTQYENLKAGLAGRAVSLESSHIWNSSTVYDDTVQITMTAFHFFFGRSRHKSLWVIPQTMKRIQLKFVVSRVCAEVHAETDGSRKRNVSFKGCCEIWNSSFLLFFSPEAEDFLRVRLPFAARWRLLLPGNRHNNDTGALSHPAFVVFASSPQ